MRFVATIHTGDILVARMSVDPREGESVGETSYRARATLIRDANRHRHPDLTDEKLDRIADTFRDMVASQILTGESRAVTCTASAKGYVTFEGEVATLTRKGDCIAMLYAHDDAWIASREDFLSGALKQNVAV